MAAQSSRWTGSVRLSAVMDVKKTSDSVGGWRVEGGPNGSTGHDRATDPFFIGINVLTIIRSPTFRSHCPLTQRIRRAQETESQTA